SRPRPRVLIRDERHRRDGAGTMTVLARALEDWRDVPRERHRRRGLLRGCGRVDSGNAHEREKRSMHESSAYFSNGMLDTAGGRGRLRRYAYTSARSCSDITLAVYGGMSPRGART